MTSQVPMTSEMPLTARLLADAGFPGERAVFTVSSFRLEVEDGSHPWVTENAEAIARNWDTERAANPRLFNGQMVLQRALSYRDGHLEGRAHLVPFAAFLHWRRSGRGAGAHHLFAMPLIVSADDALMAIRMAQTTANPGKVYSPAGSLDASDIAEGVCDLDANIRRETLEETGLDLADMLACTGWRAAHVANSVSLFRVFRSRLDAEALQSRVALHIAADPEPEISEIIAIRSPDPAAHDYSPSMPPVLEWLFSQGMM